MKVVYLILSLLILNACNQKNNNTVAQQIKVQNEKLKQVVLTKNINLLDEVYDTAAYYLSPGEAPVKGLTDIKQHWKEGIEAMTDMHSETLEIIGNGEVVSEVGLVSTAIKLKDTAFVYKAKYNNVWVKNTEGTYKLKVDIWNNF